MLAMLSRKFRPRAASSSEVKLTSAATDRSAILAAASATLTWSMGSGAGKRQLPVRVAFGSFGQPKPPNPVGAPGTLGSKSVRMAGQPSLWIAYVLGNEAPLRATCMLVTLAAQSDYVPRPSSLTYRRVRRPWNRAPSRSARRRALPRASRTMRTCGSALCRSPWPVGASSRRR